LAAERMQTACERDFGARRSAGHVLADCCRNRSGVEGVEWLNDLPWFAVRPSVDRSHAGAPRKQRVHFRADGRRINGLLPSATPYLGDCATPIILGERWETVGKGERRIHRRAGVVIRGWRASRQRMPHSRT
jgi:hypothetical protein